SRRGLSREVVLRLCVYVANAKLGIRVYQSHAAGPASERSEITGTAERGDGLWEPHRLTATWAERCVQIGLHAGLPLIRGAGLRREPRSPSVGWDRYSQTRSGPIKPYH